MEVPEVRSYDEDRLLARMHSEDRGRRLAGHLAFIGFMGAGKSSLGRLIAERIGRPFFDTDVVVEERSGRAIADFFASGEEPAFRALERETIAELLERPPLVLALGGGALQDRQTRRLLFERGFVVHLFVSWAHVRACLPALVDGRPLLQDRSASEVYDLYLRRQQTYRDAHLRIDAPRGDLAAAADEVCARLFAEHGV
jgi:shikimate kinase